MKLSTKISYIFIIFVLGVYPTGFFLVSEYLSWVKANLGVHAEFIPSWTVSIGNWHHMAWNVFRIISIGTVLIISWIIEKKSVQTNTNENHLRLILVVITILLIFCWLFIIMLLLPFCYPIDIGDIEGHS